MVISLIENISFYNQTLCECNVIAVENKSIVKGVVAFSHTTFRDCEFDSVTFILSKQVAKHMRDEAARYGGNIQVLGAPIE